MDRWNANVECCGNCDFWPLGYRAPDPGHQPYGIGGPHTDGSVSDCRRYAPRDSNQQRYPSDTACWPTTKRTDYCGDFELRDAG